MSFPRSHPPLKWMGNFKAVAIDYEYYLTLSDKPESICLTERQMYVLSVQNSYTYWLTRWYNTDDITQQTVQYIAAEIESLLMCGCGFPVPSLTDRLNGNTYITNSSTSYIETYNTWNDGGQTVVSIAPNLDYGTGTPADIELLMCHGIALFVHSILESIESVLEGNLEEGQDIISAISHALAGLGVAGGAATVVFGTGAAFLGFAAGPLVVLALAIGAVITSIPSLFSTDIVTFQDEDAIDDVICTMQNNTAGANMTQSAFAGSLTPNDFVPGSNAEKLATLLQPFLADIDTYLQFLVATNSLYAIANIGALPECGCTEPPDPACVDLTTTAEQWTFPSGFGSWIDGQGLAPVNSGGTPLFYASRTQNAAGVYCNRFTISFSAPTSAIIVFNAHDSWHYSGAAITTLDVNPTTAPTMFPGGHFNIGSTGSQIGVTFESGSVAPSLAWRMIESCIYLEP